jgi:site-specific DNA-methyltransferase (adenine-specific)
MKDHRHALDQFFTQAWAAELLFDAYFSHLTASDMVWEPTCGNGNWLAAIPAHIPCIGTEIDPVLARVAAQRSGREVLVGDCLSVSLPRVTAVLGNPPFQLQVFEALLERCERVLGLGQCAGFILPAYFFKNSRTTLRLGRKWSIQQEMLPADLFERLSKPLVFGLFTRDNSPQLIGFRLFRETSEARELLEHALAEPTGPRSLWRNSVIEAIKRAGGTATLYQLYQHIADYRPTQNPFWKEKVRQVVQQKPFVRTGPSTYQLN